LLVKLKKQQNQQAVAQAKLLEAKQQHTLKTINSINIICRSVAQQQCDISEASWRLSVLLEKLEGEQFNITAQEYDGINQLYQGIKHMPILDERKALPKQERMRFDLARMKLEAQLGEQVQQEISSLADKTSRFLTPQA
jgi:hypothetical protein